MARSPSPEPRYDSQQEHHMLTRSKSRARSESITDQPRRMVTRSMSRGRSPEPRARSVSPQVRAARRRAVVDRESDIASLDSPQPLDRELSHISEESTGLEDAIGQIQLEERHHMVTRSQGTQEMLSLNTDMQYQPPETPREVLVARPLLLAGKAHQYPLDKIPKLDNMPELDGHNLMIRAELSDGTSIDWEPESHPYEAMIIGSPDWEDESYIQQEHLDVIIFNKPTEVSFHVTPHCVRKITLHGSLGTVMKQIYNTYQSAPIQEEIDDIPDTAHIYAKISKKICEIEAWSGFYGFRRINGKWWLP